MSLTFKQISKINYKRALRWHKDSLNDWSISDWSTAMAGEAGEICNAVKKLRRLESEFTSINESDRQINSKKEAIEKIGAEIADTFLYLNLLAIRCGLDFEQEIIKKFNSTSDKYGFTEKL